MPLRAAKMRGVTPLSSFQASALAFGPGSMPALSKDKKVGAAASEFKHGQRLAIPEKNGFALRAVLF
eukprot:656086-Pelagomonas_calceolata.AAC.2